MDDQDLVKVVDKAFLPLDAKLVMCYRQLQVHVFSIVFEIPVTEDEKLSLGLTKDIVFVADRSATECNVKYLYKSSEVIALECESPSVQVSKLRVLQECVRQDTNEPDIRPIQNGTIS